ncbi:TPA: hypothetical protein M2Q89_000710 [Escherichia coli]|nr:hypothetical protein [Escherichia coli]
MAIEIHTYTINADNYLDANLPNSIHQLKTIADETSKSPIEIYSSIYNRIRYEGNKGNKEFVISFIKPTTDKKDE